MGETGHPRGETVDCQTVYELSRDWYGDRFDLDWERRGPQEADAILARHGLTGDFWAAGEGTGGAGR